MGVEQEIRDKLAQGMKSKEIIAQGYNPDTVYKIATEVKKELKSKKQEPGQVSGGENLPEPGGESSGLEVITPERRNAPEVKEKEGMEIRETVEEPARAEPKARAEAVDDFGCWKRVYLPHTVFAVYNFLKAKKLTVAESISEFLAECVDLALELGFRHRIMMEQILSREERLRFLSEKQITREELKGLLKAGYLSNEEYAALIEEMKED